MQIGAKHLNQMKPMYQDKAREALHSFDGNQNSRLPVIRAPLAYQYKRRFNNVKLSYALSDVHTCYITIDLQLIHHEYLFSPIM